MFDPFIVIGRDLIKKHLCLCSCQPWCGTTRHTIPVPFLLISELGMQSDQSPVICNIYDFFFSLPGTRDKILLNLQEFEEALELTRGIEFR